MSIVTAAAQRALTGLKNTEVMAARELTRHAQSFNLRKLGNRHLLGAIMTIEPGGMLLAHGHSLVKHDCTAWYFMQDISNRTHVGRGYDCVHGDIYSISIKLEHLIAESKLGQRVASSLAKLNWSMTATAVTSQKHWQDAIGNLPTNVSPQDLEDLRLPTLMTTQLQCATPEARVALCELLAESHLNGVYRAWRHSRVYRTPFDGTVTVVDDKDSGCQIITITPTENIATTLTYHSVEAVCELHVQNGGTVQAGEKIMTMFPKSDFKRSGPVAHQRDQQWKELSEAFNEAAVLAMNQVFMSNEVFVYEGNSVAVPFLIAISLSDSTLMEYGTTREMLTRRAVYDTTHVTDCADDETNSYILPPIQSVALKGRRWLGDITLNVEMA